MVMKVEKKSTDEVQIVLDEVFDFKKAEEFRLTYESVVCAGVKIVTINFLSTRCMDSSGLGMLLNVQSYFKDKDIAVSLINPSDQIRKIFSISSFDRRFTIL
jgi:HptB-dependent secretion and biofilm anti anti-sigma factor